MHTKAARSAVDQSFLRPTAFTDCAEASLANAARNIVRGTSNARERAVAIFYWVRDHHEYRLGLWPHRASETLRIGFGSCTNKANLFVALARAQGIEAGFHVMRVDASRYFGPVVSPRLANLFSPRSIHTYAAVRPARQWIKVDPSDDIVLSLCGKHMWPEVQPVEFDGRNDARLNIDPGFVLDDSTPVLASIDEHFDTPLQMDWGLIDVINGYVAFLRRHMIFYDACETLFDDYLRTLVHEDEARFRAFLRAERKHVFARAQRFPGSLNHYDYDACWSARYIDRVA